MPACCEAVRHLVALAGDDAGEGLGALAHRTAAFPRTLQAPRGGSDDRLREAQLSRSTSFCRTTITYVRPPGPSLR